LQDLTSQNNGLPVNILENPSKFKIKKKLVLKNPMEDIPEEEANINNDMEIKDQNHQQVTSNPDHQSLHSLFQKPMEEKRE
jgi:hypothetical protein